MAAPLGLHSRIVAVLKVGLPLVAVGMIAAMFLIQTDDRTGREIQFSQGDIDALGEGLRITNPTFSGTTRDGDLFRFDADLVIPDAAPPTRAEITGLSGELKSQDGTTLRLTAEAGSLDIESQHLDLSGDVRIETSDGYRMDSEMVAVDLQGGVLRSDAPIRTVGPLGSIEAGTLAIENEAPGAPSRRISFGNGVRLIYLPSSAAD